jgi:hypothetical protein
MGTSPITDTPKNIQEAWMDHRELESIAQSIFGFVPNWTPHTVSSIIDKCARLKVNPAVYLRAFADNTKINAGAWWQRSLILNTKWDQYVKPALQQLETEAKVTYEHDAVVFMSTLDIEDSAEDVLNLESANISAVGRVHYAKLYRLPHVADKWMSSAKKQALANPKLAEIYGFWQD